MNTPHPSHTPDPPPGPTIVARIGPNGGIVLATRDRFDPTATIGPQLRYDHTAAEGLRTLLRARGHGGTLFGLATADGALSPSTADLDYLADWLDDTANDRALEADLDQKAEDEWDRYQDYLAGEPAWWESPETSDDLPALYEAHHARPYPDTAAGEPDPDAKTAEQATTEHDPVEHDLVEHDLDEHDLDEHDPVEHDLDEHGTTEPPVAAALTTVDDVTTTDTGTEDADQQAGGDKREPADEQTVGDEQEPTNERAAADEQTVGDELKIASIAHAEIQTDPQAVAWTTHGAHDQAAGSVRARYDDGLDL